MKSKPIEFSIQFRNAELHFTQTAGRRRPDANWLDCRAPAIIIEQRATSLTIISALVAETARLRSMISNSITSDPNSQMYQTTLMGRAAVLLVILSNRTTSHHIAPKMLVSRRHSNIIGSMVAADCTIFACVENTNRIYSSRLYCQDSAQVHNTNTSLASINRGRRRPVSIVGIKRERDCRSELTLKSYEYIDNPLWVSASVSLV